MAIEYPRIMIAKLYPYESSGASGKVKRHRRTINSTGKLEPIEVLQIDGSYLVVDGTNRVLAAIECGWKEIAVRFVHRQPQEMGAYKAALEEARREKRLGFRNMLTGGVGGRADEYKASGSSVIDEFAKGLMESNEHKPEASDETTE